MSAITRVLVGTFLGWYFGCLIGSRSSDARPLVDLEAVPMPRELWDPWIDEQDDASGHASPIAAGQGSWPASNIMPERAIVRPRVTTASGAMPLEDEIWPLVKEGRRGTVRLWGAPGSGKTTALRHLAALLPLSAPVVLLDRPDEAEVASAAHRGLVIYAAGRILHEKVIASFTLAPWGDDEVIEYLLAVDRDRCADVMARLKTSEFRIDPKKVITASTRSGWGDGERIEYLLFDRERSSAVMFDKVLAPELWRVILDRFLSDDSVSGVRQAIRLEVAHWLATVEERATAQQACLETILSESAPPALTAPDEGLFRLTRHRPVMRMLAADRIVARLASNETVDALPFLRRRHPQDLLDECGPLLASTPEAIERLVTVLRSTDNDRHAMAASLLHFSGTGWMPEPGRIHGFPGASLAGAQWPEVDLADADLNGVDLDGASLAGAILDRAKLHSGRFSSANFRNANLDAAIASKACFKGADLSYVRARKANFNNSDMEGANLEGACLRRAWLHNTNLTDARFVGADLAHALLECAKIEGADFTNAELEGAYLKGLPLNKAKLLGARFQAARMTGCILEEVDLPSADFEDAVLSDAVFTGSQLPNANFLGATLRGAKLAEVHWPDACLRDADLRQVNFHMGTTRSGMIASTVPCEGSRTGFYTDDFQDREHLPPEQIRKANLCGADLRGADISGTDFYLVDLRGAQYSVKQGNFFRSCGAILGGGA